jgi:hypothetical protein
VLLTDITATITTCTNVGTRSLSLSLAVGTAGKFKHLDA